MKTLRIDEKWSIDYDPESNDAPRYWRRHGLAHRAWDEKNSVTALFYALLDARQEPNA